MTLDVGPALRTALVDQVSISGLLGDYEGEPSIHTRRPIPDSAEYPLIVINPDLSIIDFDGLRSERPIVVRDIIVYGHQPEDYRVVEQVGYLIRSLLHRERLSIDVDGYDVVQIVANGPRAAPTDDEQTVARVVTVTISLRKNP